MKKFIISYDVKLSSDYDSLYKYIQKHENVHLTESLFAIKSGKTQSQIRDDISERISSGSSVFVTQLDGYACRHPIDGAIKLSEFYNS